MKYEEGLLSVIIPVYNTELYVRKCLESVINQTYPHLDIIVVDDGSTDGGGKICDEYQKADKRIRVFHKKNEGASSARNLGLHYAKGEFIGFVDSDDFIDLDMYESMLYEMEDDVDIVVCGRRISFPKGVHQKSRFAYGNPKRIKMSNITAMESLLKHTNVSFSVCDKVFRRQLFKGVKFPYKRLSEDIPVTYKMIAKSRNVVHLGKSKYNNFHRNDSTSRQEFYYRQIDYVLFVGKICKDIPNQYPQLLMQAEALYVLCTFSMIRKIQSCQNRLQYQDIEKRLLKVLWHMYGCILHNSFILSPKKWEIFMCMLGENKSKKR